MIAKKCFNITYIQLTMWKTIRRSIQMRRVMCKWASSKIVTHIILIITCVCYMCNKKSSIVIKGMKQYDRFASDMKNVLLWSPINEIKEEKQSPFFKKKCRFHNCYVTNNRSLLGDTRLFDAIIFNCNSSNLDLPRYRSKSQKFIFLSKQSADSNPVCDVKFDNFFNWTWTYRSDSEIKIRFYSILNLAGEDLGTSEYFKWYKNMDPIDDNFKTNLGHKYKAAAWFVDNCNTISKREVFVEHLKKSLAKYNLTVDTYGACGDMKCKRKTMAACYWKLKRTYFFYLAFEDSFDKDYVTDTVLHGMKNNAVPVVYGGADYDKFLPPGSYLNGLQLGEDNLATAMYEAIIDNKIYYKFFSWRSHYIIRENPNYINICDLCQKLNDKQYLKFKINYPEFRAWWNKDYVRRCDLGSTEIL